MSESLPKYKYYPSAEYRYWLHDPSGNGMVYFRSVADRDTTAEAAIACYLDEAWDEGVESVAVGEVTHVATQVDRTDRPDELDEENYDDEGDYWPLGTEYRCNYELRPLCSTTEDWADERTTTL